MSLHTYRTAANQIDTVRAHALNLSAPAPTELHAAHLLQANSADSLFEVPAHNEIRITHHQRPTQLAKRGNAEGPGGLPQTASKRPRVHRTSIEIEEPSATAAAQLVGGQLIDISHNNQSSSITSTDAIRTDIQISEDDRWCLNQKVVASAIAAVVAMSEIMNKKKHRTEIIANSSPESMERHMLSLHVILRMVEESIPGGILTPRPDIYGVGEVGKMKKGEVEKLMAELLSVCWKHLKRIDLLLSELRNRMGLWKSTTTRYCELFKQRCHEARNMVEDYCPSAERRPYKERGQDHRLMMGSADPPANPWLSLFPGYQMCTSLPSFVTMPVCTSDHFCSSPDFLRPICRGKFRACDPSRQGSPGWRTR
ncbi:uncharacterized protein PGTG_16611 [Puccinia graminis f. sp. tritici CRL 75-36-700-3]|uniref:Uncharacterized protein n=1 Tax=Puccinia graminis f. sp. tritici (strain CRL 75-36-700-3 / race SCCL) TaxID=418459 RepID=E3L210_PUCGT|nr:uncharacterized protein PGTG_16611 [Puccinia graminis f. sp. tritici CRL 75-36-700-3]EFP90585.1 hypothetical protein PGTG_16611 [Puccinia graminis f. sp. tritici CRL 75-36-700-3]